MKEPCNGEFGSVSQFGEISRKESLVA